MIPVFPAASTANKPFVEPVPWPMIGLPRTKPIDLRQNSRRSAPPASNPFMVVVLAWKASTSFRRRATLDCRLGDVLHKPAASTTVPVRRAKDDQPRAYRSSTSDNI